MKRLKIFRNLKWKDKYIPYILLAICMIKDAPVLVALLENQTAGSILGFIISK